MSKLAYEMTLKEVLEQYGTPDTNYDAPTEAFFKTLQDGEPNTFQQIHYVIPEQPTEKTKDYLEKAQKWFDAADILVWFDETGRPGANICLFNGEIHFVYIHKKHRSKGLGKPLFRYAWQRGVRSPHNATVEALTMGHKYFVELALEEGIEVKEEVMKDYRKKV